MALFGFASVTAIVIILVYMLGIYIRERFKHILVGIGATVLLMIVSFLYFIYFTFPITDKSTLILIVRSIGILGSSVVLLIYLYKRSIIGKEYIPFEPFVVYILYGLTIGMLVSQNIEFQFVNGIWLPSKRHLMCIYVIFSMFSGVVFYTLMRSYMIFYRKGVGENRKAIIWMSIAFGIGFIGIIPTIVLPSIETYSYESFFILSGAYILMATLVKYPDIIFTLPMKIRAFFIITQEGIPLYIKSLSKDIKADEISGYLVFFSLIFEKIPIIVRRKQEGTLILEHEVSVVFYQRGKLIAIAIMEEFSKHVIQLQKTIIQKVINLVKERDVTALPEETLERIEKEVNKMLSPFIEGTK